MLLLSAPVAAIPEIHRSMPQLGTCENDAQPEDLDPATALSMYLT